MLKFHIATIVLFFAAEIFPCDYPDDPEMQSRKESCITASKEWNCQLNRCMTTQKAFEARRQFQQCQKLESDADKEECYLKLAEEETGLNRGARPKDNKWETAAVGLSGAYALIGAISWNSKNGGNCLSKKIMAGGSGAHLATHFLLLKKSKKKFDSIAARSQSTANDYNAQIRAFHLLREEQTSIKKYAQKKKKTYTLVAAAYGGALSTAILEKSGSFGLTSCEQKQEDSEGEPIPSDKKKKSTFSKIKKGISIKSSTQVALYSGIGMGLAFKLRQAAAKEAKKAERNIKDIDHIIAQFQDSIATYCPEGREDLKNPRCYCYDTKGEPHSQRTKSAICQKLWKEDNVNYAVEAGLYNKTESDLRGCLTLAGEFDADCRCRKYKNSATNKNLCFQASQNIVIPSPLKNNLSGAGEALKAADILTGASNSAELNSAKLNKAAAQSRRYAEKLLSQYNRQAPSLKAPVLPLSPSLLNQAVKKMVTPQIQKRFGSGNAAISSLSSMNRHASPSLSQAVKALKQKKKDSSPAYTKKSPKIKGNKKQSSSFNWPTGQSSSHRTGQTLQIPNQASYHKQKNAALHTNSKKPIWKIISNRYLLSGIPALFKKEKP